MERRLRMKGVGDIKEILEMSIENAWIYGKGGDATRKIERKSFKKGMENGAEI